MNIRAVFKEIKNITYKLVEVGLADEFSIPIANDSSVYWKGCSGISISMKNIPYSDIYHKIIENKNFNFKLPDGGVLQLLYEFDNKGLLKHRLAYFPSPDFEEFQNNPDIYYNDEIYGDIVNRQVMPVIVRIDYNRKAIESNTHHPYCHLTLGQYKNCRIPVEKPISPNQFVKFILDNFYYVPSKNFLEYKLEDYVTIHESHIYESDLLNIHMRING
ncbi:DUF2290 domain-containing protein [Clostridium gasigenes]|uniref:DUF2290 domain-containing protein n=1 Tax=Clostridium gasigenes TaxID=94869 RepID=UPI001C0BD14E|nr:DUF2290 domain-containing protein [Clostridium gasigenes]MBU3105758.1 DUF2290 domain-containing protein [Clostridium gasigenes]